MARDSARARCYPHRSVSAKVNKIRGTPMPAETVTFESDGAGALEQGWATVLGRTIDRVRIGCFAVFRQKAPGKQDSEAVFRSATSWTTISCWCTTTPTDSLPALPC
jgi:hypothetical protein